MKASARAKRLADEVNQLLGAKVVQVGSSEAWVVKHLQTGLLPIDILLQGGLPIGRFTILVGDFSTLKTLIGLYAIKECQDRGGTAGLIDTEHSYDPDWAAQIGVDTDALIVFPDPENEDFVPGEMAIDAAEVMARQGIDLLVFDSIAATLPQAEGKKRLANETQQMARLAALMSKAGRKLVNANRKTAFLWINQFRMNVGVTFGNPQVMTGGKAMPYYASHIIEIQKVGKITRDVRTFDGEEWKKVKEQIGQKFKATITKSKLSKPFREVYFNWDLNEACIDLPTFCIAQGVELGIVKVRGKTWEGVGVKAVGRPNYRRKVIGTPGALQALETAVRDAHGIPLAAPPAPIVRKGVATKKPTLTRRRKR